MQKLSKEDMVKQERIIALQEIILRYFKGNQGLVGIEADGIIVQQDMPRMSYRYQRREMENRRPTRIFIDNKAYALLTDNPSKILFRKATLTNMMDIHTPIEEFMEQYLAGVERKTGKLKSMQDYNDFTSAWAGGTISEAELSYARAQMRSTFVRMSTFNELRTVEASDDLPF